MLHELLADDGSLWMTLDDNEAFHAEIILKEIFGQDNVKADIVWRSSDNSNNDAKGFSTDKNHLFVVSKSKDWRPNKLDAPEKRGHFKNPNNDPRGPWFDGNPVDSPSPRPNLIFNLPTPSGKEIEPPRNGWRWERLEIETKIASGEIRFNIAETRIIRRTYLHEMKGLPPSDLWIDLEQYGHNRAAKYELQGIFGGISPFETPKPTKLISAILEAATHEKGLILDSFSGSGTTAHAVLNANARDGGNRRFILVEGEAYADTLTAERVRRVIKGYTFKGTQREELHSEPITFSKLRNANTMLETVTRIETLDGPRFDRIRPTVRNGRLIVTGEREVAETAPGLGAEFTYCTLGAPVDMDAILSGEGLPTPAAMAGLLWHTATAQPFDAGQMVPAPDMGEGVARLGNFAGRTYWLMYRDDLAWLKSDAAALSLTKARAIAASASGNHLVFAPAKFVSRELLARERLDVDYAPLPFALYRLETA